MVDPNAAGLDQRLGPLVPRPLGNRGLKGPELQALGPLDVEDVVELDELPVSPIFGMSTEGRKR